MSIIQRFKTFIKVRKESKDNKCITITVHTSPAIEEDKGALYTAIQVVDQAVGPRAEVDLPQYLSAAIHDPEVLSLRPSLGLPRFNDDEEPMTPSSAYTGRTLFVTNADPAQSSSTVVTSLRSSSSLGSFASCSSDAHTASPLRLYDFVNIRGLGVGGFGAVHLVKHQPTGLKVALKAVDKRFCDHKTVHAEQRALLRLASQGTRGILEFLGSFHNSRHYFFVTAYYPRGDLKVEINRWGRIPPKLAKFYAAELVLAIQTIHDHGIVHRDIKPDNVFIREDGHLVLGDLGLAASIVPPGETFVPGTECKWFLRDLAGTLHYLSPEMLQGEPYSFSVDVWAFGIVVFEMLFGRTPWQGSLHDDMSIMERHMKHETLDEWLGTERPDKVIRLFLEGMLEKDVFDRPTLEEARSHAFFKGISWSKLSRGEVPVPDVGSPPHQTPKDPDVFFGSFGGGGVYMRDEDPLPNFNYRSPTLMATDRRSRDSKRCIASSSCSSSFEDIPLTDSEDSTSGLASQAALSSASIVATSVLHSPTIIVSTPAAVTSDLVRQPLTLDKRRTVAACGGLQIERDLVGPVGAAVAVQHQRLTVLIRLRTLVGKALKTLKRICSLFPLHH